MARSPLVTLPTDQALALVQQLIKSGVMIRAAFWSWASVDADARLVIVSPLVDTDGSLKTYRRVRALLDQRPDVHLTLSDMNLVGEGDLIYRHIRMLAQPQPVPHTIGFSLASSSAYAPYIPEDASSVTIHLFYWQPADAAEGASSPP